MLLPKRLEQDRKRAGWSVGQAAWRLGLSVREYRELTDRFFVAGNPPQEVTTQPLSGSPSVLECV
jgi:hypothetical protein